MSTKTKSQKEAQLFRRHTDQSLSDAIHEQARLLSVLIAVAAERNMYVMLQQERYSRRVRAIITKAYMEPEIKEEKKED